MCDVRWPTLPLTDASPWHLFLAKAAGAPPASVAAVGRIDATKRTAYANWWTLGMRSVSLPAVHCAIQRMPSPSII